MLAACATLERGPEVRFSISQLREITYLEVRLKIYDANKVVVTRSVFRLQNNSWNALGKVL